MLLFCLLLAYVIVRVSEDVSAAVRKQPPPRQEVRKAKLAAREQNGGTVPTGSFGRYATGLLDDAWDSAHHKRQVMAEHRKEKQDRKIAKKVERDRAKWAKKDAKQAQRGGAGFTATVPTPGQHAADPAAGEHAQRAGFYAQVPQPGQGPASEPCPQPSRYAELDPRRRQLVDGWMRANPTGEHYWMTLPDYFGLPTDVRSEMLASAWRAGFRPAGRVNGQEVPLGQLDPEAVGQLKARGITAPPGPQSTGSAAGTATAGGALAGALAGGLAGAASGPPTAAPTSPEPPTQPQGPVESTQQAEPSRQNASEDTATGTESAGAEATEAKEATAEPATDSTDKEGTDTADTTADSETTDLPNNVIPFKRNATGTTQRMELPVTNPEITGLDSAIAYANGMSAQCTQAHDQISAILPTSDEAVASCEQARNDLEAGGVTGQPLTDVTEVQEQMTAAIAELQAALAQLETAAAAANSLSTELESHRGVQEAYAATPDAGSKEFVTAE